MNYHVCSGTGRAVGMEIMLPDPIPEEATKAILRLKEKKYLTKQQKLALINSTVLNNIIPLERSVNPLGAR